MIVLSESKVITFLRKKGLALVNASRTNSAFTKDVHANNMLNDHVKFPHLFVLGCVMDRQIKAERAWLIPIRISRKIGGASFSDFYQLDEGKLVQMFNREKYHRFNNTMPKYFYSAIQKIHDKYNDDASNIWQSNLKSATIVRRFIQFDGVSIKIASMAANILAREFKIPMQDYLCIDISPDRHIRRVLKRTGIIPWTASNEELIYRARELNPEYPGVFDSGCFEIGRNFCHQSNPDCTACPLTKMCPKSMSG